MTSSAIRSRCPVVKTATAAIRIKNRAKFAIIDIAKIIPKKIFHPLPFLAGTVVGLLAATPGTGSAG
jgi:hypothetical protein